MKDEIMFTRVTMMIGSHWSVFKSQYLRHDNRPRIDSFLYVLQQCLISTVKRESGRLLYVIKRPAWWYALTKQRMHWSHDESLTRCILI